MKETVKISRACGYLEKIYRQLNADMFNGELCQPVITIQSTPRAYGHVTINKIWQVKDNNQYELNIGAGTLNRHIEDIVATMLHEMVHIYHLMNDIQDTSRGGTYHNKRFKEKAESLGLVVEHDSRIGYSITRPSDELVEYIISQNWEDLLMNRNERLKVGKGTGKGTDKKPSSTRKYVCPCCNISVRATKEVRISCYDCSELMELAQ